jgi:hypothetical protein
MSQPSAPQQTMSDDQIKYMVNRFLMWRLPENFNPDGGISFQRMRNEHTAFPAKNEPVGTNLLDAQQAEMMVRYLIDGLPQENSDNYVAWLRYSRRENGTTIQVCDSDTPGAFKVYREEVAAPVPPTQDLGVTAKKCNICGGNGTYAIEAGDSTWSENCPACRPEAAQDATKAKDLEGILRFLVYHDKPTSFDIRDTTLYDAIITWRYQAAVSVVAPSAPQQERFPNGIIRLVCECGHVETEDEWNYDRDCKCGGKWINEHESEKNASSPRAEEEKEAAGEQKLLPHTPSCPALNPMSDDECTCGRLWRTRLKIKEAEISRLTADRDEYKRKWNDLLIWEDKALAQARKLEAVNASLTQALDLALIPLAALVVSGECVAAQTALAEGGNLMDARTLAEQDMAKVILNAIPQLEYVLRQFGCPCGARPESLDTHPHVGGCGIAQLLELNTWAIENLGKPKSQWIKITDEFQRTSK